jgi:hypothetical protein
MGGDRWGERRLAEVPSGAGFTVDPHVEILVCLVSGKRDKHALEDPSPFCCREQARREKDLWPWVVWAGARVRSEVDHGWLGHLDRAMAEQGEPSGIYADN